MLITKQCALYVAVLFLSTWQITYANASENVSLVIDSITVRVEVARTDKELQQGLSGRDYLSPNEGMLFIFNPPRTACLWMKDTKIPLQAIFINAEGEVINTTKMEPFSHKIHCALEKTAYALEVNDGLLNAIIDDSPVLGLPK